MWRWLEATCSTPCGRQLPEKQLHTVHGVLLQWQRHVAGQALDEQLQSSHELQRLLHGLLRVVCGPLHQQAAQVVQPQAQNLCMMYDQC